MPDRAGSRLIVLASGSPRRCSLLRAAGFEVVVSPSDADETWPGGDPEAAAIEIAQRKLDRVADARLTLAADTAVVLEGESLGKPRDAAEAAAMLSKLAGRMHTVVTGVCLRRGDAQRAFAVSTEVRFRTLRRHEIDAYASTAEPLDKAGAYGIQGEGGALIDTVRGSYTNVVGLPLREVIDAVEAFA